MKRKYIEYKIAEYPQMTDKGLAWIVLYRIEYIDKLVFALKIP